jgi:short subunit dehydrogenase-like uncharacterized protein
MIPGCGAAGMPADISAFILSKHLNQSFGTKLFSCQSYLEKSLPEAPSGGSIASVHHMLSNYGAKAMENATKAFALSPVKPAYVTGEPNPGTPTEADIKREAEACFGRVNAFGIQRNPYFATAIISPLEDADRLIVTRSWGILSKTQHAYSPNFYYGGSRQPCENPVQGWILRAVFKIVVFSFSSWFGGFLLRFLPQPGEGPSEEEIKSRGLFEMTVLGVGEKVEGKESRPMASCKWQFRRDPYTFTGIGMVQAAMVLLDGGTEAHRLGGGIVCPSLLGEKYVERLRGSGGTIEVTSL